MSPQFRWFYLILVIAIAGTVIFSTGLFQVQAQETAPAAHPLADILAISPSYLEVSTGQSFSLEVRITGSNPVVAADVYITFNPSLVEVTRVTNSGALDLIADQSNLPGGVIRVGAGKLTGTPPTPPFTLLTIQGRAKSTLGSASFNFNPAETDIQGTSGSVLGGLTNGTVVIKLAPTPTITPTPSKTLTPMNTPTVTLTPTPQPGELCVLAFHDRNGNRLRDPGEELLAGAGIVVTDVGLTPRASRVTDGIHEPVCFNLPPDIYFVEETDPPGYLSTNPNWWVVDLLSQRRFTVSFADRAGAATATPTATFVPTVTQTATGTPTPTATRTATVTPTLTGMATETLTPTATQTATDAPTPSPSPSPTATVTSPTVNYLYLPALLHAR